MTNFTKKTRIYMLKVLWKLNLVEGIHYINGSETLPPPLTKAQELKIMSDIQRGVYGAREPQFGSAASVLNLFEEAYPSRTAIYGGVLAEESAALMKAFFAKKR